MWQRMSAFGRDGAVLIPAWCMALPCVIIPLYAFGRHSEALEHFYRTGLIGEYATNSLMMMFGAMLGALLCAVPTAWYTTHYRFRGKIWLEWMVILPLAMPAYVAAMIYGHLLDSAGWLQTTLRAWTGWHVQDYLFPNIRSKAGMIFILSVTLYPYIYLLARSAFRMHSALVYDAARILGCAQSALFWRVGMPMARPVLVVGMAFVGMEAMADVGVASLYGVPTLSIGVVRAWNGMYDAVAAAHIATYILMIVIFLYLLERYHRKQAHHSSSAPFTPMVQQHLTGWRWVGVLTLCALPLCLGFIIPCVMLMVWALPNLALFRDPSTLEALGYSVLIAGSTAMLACLLGFLCAYALHRPTHRLMRLSIHCATMGYALPGSVIAVGILVCITMLQSAWFSEAHVMMQTLIAVIWGCCIRFLTISTHSMRSAMEYITPSMDETAMMLGYNTMQRLRYVHVPLIRSAMVAACIMIFIDTMKELPVSLLLRPFDVTTLAIRTYELAKEEMMIYAAPSALMLVGVSIPAALLSMRVAR
ncbi:MAG: iron ABC transporter permease [Alphaproteobacteria bacterium]|nr:MAG: iron ABC transporter permease [Alphaproteobacteria bacterium]TAF77176.1 MAG: iron ABC transporter permease [Alphaproteobacteria bacterium]